MSDDFEAARQFEELAEVVRRRLPKAEHAEAIETLRDFFNRVAAMNDEQREQVIAYMATMLHKPRRAD